MMRARGFSLVELMVAITLALIVTAGVMSVFVGSRSAYQSTSGVAAVSDSGRFALNFLEGAVREAGNMACGSPTRTIFNVGPGTPLNTPPFPTLAFQPITGFEAVGTGILPPGAYNVTATPGAPGNWLSPIGWAGGLDPAFASLALAVPPALPVINNDILVVRSSTQGATPVYVTNAAAGANNFTVVAVPGTFAAGDLAIISDCVKSLIFQISAVGPTTITHNTGGVPGNLTNTFPPQVNFDPGSEVTLLQATAYYIGVGADGDGALFSANLSAGNSFTSVSPISPSPNELVPDIEAMQILYGLDTIGTRTVSQWVTADQVPDYSSVMSVHIALLAAGPLGSAPLPTVAKTFILLGTQVTAPIDTRNRQVFDVTVGVRNLLP